MASFNKEKAKKIGGIAFNAVIWLVVVISLLVTILVFSAQGSKDGVPALFGKSLITVQSESMEPTFNRGDLLFMSKISDEEKVNLKPGDIITYHAPIDINKDGQTGDINTHRIVSVDLETRTVKTQGDNAESNRSEDNYVVNFNDIIGTCTEGGRVGGVGSVIDFLRSSIGFLLCIVLPLVLFFLYELYRFIMIIVTERAKRAPVSAETEEEIKKRAIAEYLAAQQAAEAAKAEEAKTEEAKAEEPAAEQKPEEAEATAETTDK